MENIENNQNELNEQNNLFFQKDQVNIVSRKEFISSVKKNNVVTPNEKDESEESIKKNTLLEEDDPRKKELYELFDELWQKAINDDLSRDQLQFLCDTAFGKNTIESQRVYLKIIENRYSKHDSER